MNPQQERWGWGLRCEERNENLFLPYDSKLCYPGEQPPLRPDEFVPARLICGAGDQHQHIATRENILWLRYAE